MKIASTLGFVCLALALTGLASLPANSESTPATPAGLPGARPALDAAQFPTLQAAFDALPAEGGVVRLPAGTFEINQPLVLRASDVCIEGAGTATHIKNVNEDQQPALIVEHPDGAQDRKNELWRVRLANFRITGNEKSGHGIDARLVNEIFIEGVTVSQHGGDGIRLDRCYEDPRICDSLITYNRGTGLDLLGCHDIVVASNQFEENQDALHCLDGFNLTMSGNALDDHLGHGVVIENTYGSVVAANMIEECNGTAIILDRDCYGITLSANVIAHNGGGVDLRDAHGCAVSANTFTLMKTDALRIGPASGRIAVSGNSFCDSYIGEGSVKRRTDDLQAAGLVLAGAREVGISGNVFSGLQPKALALEGDAASQGVLFSDNLTVDAETDVAKLKDAAGNLVTDNLPSASQTSP
ncbi:MAG: right-handed parallel beta-helix repeat-containing protein [Candidatus Anammoximicrobium sp.]|nr:right-handed parallel beta-helix repeat-containing protein [Candidatus Anammoximicrobium sp.]